MSDGDPRPYVGPEIGWESGSEGFDALTVGVRDPPPTHQLQNLEILDEPVDEEHGSAPSVLLSLPDAVREDGVEHLGAGASIHAQLPLVASCVTTGWVGSRNNDN